MNAEKKFLLSLGVLLLLVVAGCGKKSEEGKKASTAQDPKEKTEAPTQTFSVDPTQAGILRGKVTFKGEPPKPKELPVEGNPECKVFHPGKLHSEEVLVKDGALKNVFIYVKEGLENYRFDPPKDSVKIDQVKCVYVPHVVGSQVDQPILLVNSDPTLHNIHSYSKDNPTWNLGMPFEGMELTKKFSKPEVMVSLKCDVHPWMIGYIGVVSHPYFAVTGEDGRFELKNLPPGEYLVEAWHEKLGIQTQKIKISAQETKEIEFSFSTKE